MASASARRGAGRPRDRRGGRHRLRSDRPRLQRRQRDQRPAAASEPPPTCSWAPASPRCFRSGTSSTTARPRPNLNAVYDPTWGRVKSISRPVLGNHDGAGSVVLRLLQRRGRGERPGRAARPRLLQLRRRQLAPRRAELELHARVVRRGLDPGAVAARRSRRASRGVHARVLAPPALQLRARRQPRDAAAPSGRRWTRRARSLCCPATATTTSASRPRTRHGKTSPAGIRQFVVGTGGAFLTGLGTSRVAGSEVAQNDTFGVLKLTLHAVELRLAVRPDRRAAAGPTRARRQCHGLAARRSPPLLGTRRRPRPTARAPVLTGSERQRRAASSRHAVFRYTAVRGGQGAASGSPACGEGATGASARSRDAGDAGANRRRLLAARSAGSVCAPGCT